MENPKFSMFKRSNGYYWNLRARNGEIILHSESYDSEEGCDNGIASVKTNSPHDERYEKRIAVNGQHYFVLKSLNHKIIGVGETYTTRTARDNGIEDVKRYAPTAPVEKLT